MGETDVGESVKSITKKENFIQLRAEGLSFEKISRELNVSKKTLINWSRDFECDIQNMKSLRLDMLRERYLRDIEQRLKIYCKFQEKIEKELLSRDLKDLSTDKLYRIFDQNESKISEGFNVFFKGEEPFYGLGKARLIEWPI